MQVNFHWVRETEVTLILEVSITQCEQKECESYFTRLVSTLHFALTEDVSSNKTHYFPNVKTGYVYFERNEDTPEKQKENIIHEIKLINESLGI